MEAILTMKAFIEKLMEFLKNMLLDESGKPSSARVRKYMCLGAAVAFGLAGFWLPPAAQSYAHNLVVAFLLAGGADGVASQVKSAKVLSSISTTTTASSTSTTTATTATATPPAAPVHPHTLSPPPKPKEQPATAGSGA